MNSKCIQESWLLARFLLYFFFIFFLFSCVVCVMIKYKIKRKETTKKHRNFSYYSWRLDDDHHWFQCVCTCILCMWFSRVGATLNFHITFCVFALCCCLINVLILKYFGFGWLSSWNDERNWLSVTTRSTVTIFIIHVNVGRLFRNTYIVHWKVFRM